MICEDANSGQCVSGNFTRCKKAIWLYRKCRSYQAAMQITRFTECVKAIL